MDQFPEVMTYPQYRRSVAEYAKQVAERHGLFPVPCSPFGPITDVARYTNPQSPAEVYAAFYAYPEGLLGFCTGPKTGLALLVDNSTDQSPKEDALHFELFSGVQHAVSEIKIKYTNFGKAAYANTVLLNVGQRIFGQGIDTSLQSVEVAPDNHWAVFSPSAWSITDVPEHACCCFVKNRGPASLLSVGVRSISEETLVQLLSSSLAEDF